jgi:6-phosphogluconolactonase (cycloisomerase 2 family)
MAMFVLSLVCVGAVSADDGSRAAKSALFTITNEAEGNRVLAFRVRHHGALEPAPAVATGGLGTGDSLGSQGALVLSHDQRFLIAVDAGSNEINVFKVDGVELTLRSRIASGGVRPISVTEGCGLVYVVHAGSNDVVGFQLHSGGELSPIDGAHRSLSAAEAGPGQITLSQDARTLIVTEKTTNVITTYSVDEHGRLSEPRVAASEGMTPFGFELTSRGELVVSEAATGSMSSYKISDDGVAVISNAVPSGEMAPCWVEITADDRVAFTANAGSASISSYEISASGELSLLDATAGELGEGGAPLDLAFARNDKYLYALDRGHTRIAGFLVGESGSLSEVEGSETGLPEFTTGLAAY